MTVPRYQALTQYWRRHPPVHLLVAGFLGFKPAETQPRRSGASTDFAALAAMAPGGSLNLSAFSRS